ncbi:hypothetical protein ES705_42823 [subsurface metagenome]
MAKRKYPSELNSRTVRVNISDWHLLMELARQHDTTVAKILHLAITGQSRKESIPQTQITMPLTLAYRALSTTAIATNGNKAFAFRIKPKGVRRE